MANRLGDSLDLRLRRSPVFDDLVPLRSSPSDGAYTPLWDGLTRPLDVMSDSLKSLIGVALYFVTEGEPPDV